MTKAKVTTSDGIPVATITYLEDGWQQWEFPDGFIWHQPPPQVCQNTLARET